MLNTQSDSKHEDSSSSTRQPAPGHATSTGNVAINHAEYSSAAIYGNITRTVCEQWWTLWSLGVTASVPTHPRHFKPSNTVIDEKTEAEEEEEQRRRRAQLSSRPPPPGRSPRLVKQGRSPRYYRTTPRVVHHNHVIPSVTTRSPPSKQFALASLITPSALSTNRSPLRTSPRTTSNMMPLYAHSASSTSARRAHYDNHRGNDHAETKEEEVTDEADDAENGGVSVRCDMLEICAGLIAIARGTFREKLDALFAIFNFDEDLVLSRRNNKPNCCFRDHDHAVV